MNTLSLLAQSRNAIPEHERLVSVALLSSVILTTVHRQACGVDALPVSGALASESVRTWIYYFSTLLLFGVIPAVLIKFVWRSSLANFGVSLGDWKFGLAATAVLLPVIAVLFLIPAAQMTDMRAFYPIDKSAMESVSAFITYSLGRVLLFYVGWEFLFRGFLLFSIRRVTGDITAICIQTLPSALWHIAYPTGELYMSIAAGILFGWLALRTRSILWPLLLHSGIGIITDLSITLSR